MRFFASAVVAFTALALSSSSSGASAFQPNAGVVVHKFSVVHSTRNVASSTNKRSTPFLHHQQTNKHKKETTLSLFQGKKSTPEPVDDVPSFQLNIPAAAAWVALVAWAFTAAPGELQSDTDTAMLQAILADPVHPGINELYYTVFNFFAVIPVILASVILPQDRRNVGLPAAPFLIASSAIGYFGFGPYLALRAPPRTTIDTTIATDTDDDESIGWFTANVLENKAFAALTVLFSLYLPVAAGLFPAYQQDPAALWQGFVDLVSTSRFASVSLVDLTMLFACTVAATPRDYMLRNPNATQQDATKVAALTALLPFVGSAVYCAVRPSLLPQQKEE